MKNYKAETVLNSSSFPELWVETLSEKHIDLLIERILIFLMDHDQLSDKQLENFNRFLDRMPHERLCQIVIPLMDRNLFHMNHILGHIKGHAGELFSNNEKILRAWDEYNHKDDVTYDYYNGEWNLHGRQKAGRKYLPKLQKHLNEKLNRENLKCQ